MIVDARVVVSAGLCVSSRIGGRVGAVCIEEDEVRDAWTEANQDSLS